MSYYTTRSIKPKAPEGLTQQLDAARMAQRQANMQVAQLETVLADAQEQNAIPEMTDHEWCLELQRAKRNADQHALNLQYVSSRWLEHEFCALGVEQSKAQQVLAILKCIEQLDSQCADAEYLKLQYQYECSKMGDYAGESAKLVEMLGDCMEQIEPFLNDELRGQVARISGI